VDFLERQNFSYFLSIANYNKLFLWNECLLSSIVVSLANQKFSGLHHVALHAGISPLHKEHLLSSQAVQNYPQGRRGKITVQSTNLTGPTIYSELLYTKQTMPFLHAVADTLNPLTHTVPAHSPLI
jgi:hypothetical protein